MLRAGYGHPLSGFLFIEAVSEHLRLHGFTKIPGSRQLWTRGELLVSAYVDDILAAGPRRQLDDFWRDFRNAFQLKAAPAPVGEFLGMRVRRPSPRELLVDLDDYIADTIDSYRREWKTEPKPSTTPALHYIRSPPEERCATPEHLVKPVQRIVGRLLWISRTARPDVSQAVSGLASRAATWDSDCTLELQRLAGYLQAVPGALRFHSNGCMQLRAALYSDSDWTSPRSQSGCFACLESLQADGFVSSEKDEYGATDDVCLPVTWFSGKQTLATDSSTAAEIIALHTALKRVARFLLEFAEFLNRATRVTVNPTPSGPLLYVLVDNKGARSLRDADSESFSMYQKALSLRCHLVKDLHGVLFHLTKVASDRNRADGFTKPLPGSEWFPLLSLMSLATFGRRSPAGRAYRAAFWARHLGAFWSCLRSPEFVV
jgi:hypothetical protein